MTAVTPRSTAEITRELARIASRTEVPGLTSPTAPVTWADLLFDAEALSDVAEPSQALLAALADLQPGLEDHLATLTKQGRRWWLETHLGIPRLAAVADRAVAVATAERDAGPVVVPSRTQLKGGRTSAGTDRIYTTDDTLTVLGATLVGVRGYHADADRDHVTEWSDVATLLAPFATDTPASHHLDIVTDLIAFEDGSLSVEVRFESVTAGIADELEWWYSTADGLSPAVRTSASATQVELQLDGACQPYPLDGESVTFLRAALPNGSYPAGALSFRFARVKVSAARDHIPADGGFYNDGALDVTKEFQPFGPTPRRGDSFYIQSDEAFSKPLSSLTVHLVLLDEEEQSLLPVDFASPYQPRILHEVQQFQIELGEAAESYSHFFEVFGGGPPATALWWQRYLGGAWDTFDTTGGTFGGDLPGAAPSTIAGNGASEPATIAGVDGRFIRVFLAQGDFGWNAYLRRLADFAAAAAGPGNPDPDDLVPPNPPVVSTLHLSYATPLVQVNDLRLTNGWGRGRPTPGTELTPFFEPLPPSTPRPSGAVAVGVALDDQVLGSTFSMFLQIDAADACPSLGRQHEVRWQYWSPFGWTRLDVVDAASGLRQTGLVRFVAPVDWVDGCPDMDQPTGRWLRVVVATPGQVGTLVAIHLDAVLATRVADADPNTPLASGAMKGPRTKIPGVKTITNPAAGLPGRDPEPDDHYLARASQVTRHRNRAIQAWDYEHLVLAEEPQVAAVRCLPHTDADGNHAPGMVALVVVPRTGEFQPSPSVTLAERIGALLRPRMPLHAHVAVICPSYVTVGIDADIVLAPGVAAADAHASLRAAIDTMLHPLTTGAPPFGRALYRSTVVAFVEGRGEVDHVVSLALKVTTPSGTGSGHERVDVQPTRGLIASSGSHDLGLEEQL